MFFQLDQGICHFTNEKSSSSRLCTPVVVSKIFGGLAFQASIPPFTPGLQVGDELGWVGMYGGDSTCTNLPVTENVQETNNNMEFDDQLDEVSYFTNLEKPESGGLRVYRTPYTVYPHVFVG